MTTFNNSKIRFIGFSVPTTPANLVDIGNPNGPGAVAGTYLGNEDLETDIQARIDLLKNAVDQAKGQLSDNGDPTVTNIFVAPEFYFHGSQGPYIYGSGDTDPADIILKKLKDTFSGSEYHNWSFVFGTAITAQVDNIENIYNSNNVKVRNNLVKALSEQWLASFGPLNDVIFDMLVNFIKNCHSYPNMEVRNRALLFSNIDLYTPADSNDKYNQMTTEKYYVSNEDFLLYEVNGKSNVVTEQMTAYPYIDLSDGDLKKGQYDQHAIFRQHYGETNFPDYVDFAVEICLDHSDVRLRRNINNEPFPKESDAVHIQIIPSCGMQVQIGSVAADRNGFVFNCDGQYALGNSPDKISGKAQKDTLNKVQSVYANYILSSNKNYAAHTQLARIEDPAKGGDPNVKDSDASFQTLETDDIKIVSVDATTDIGTYFAGGPGAVHIYGHKNPYTLYPDQD